VFYLKKIIYGFIAAAFIFGAGFGLSNFQKSESASTALVSPMSTPGGGGGIGGGTVEG
jgi:hypothetical protein